MRGTPLCLARPGIWLVAFWLADAGLPRRLTLADDDAVVAQPQGPGRLHIRPPTADREQPRAGPFVVSLTNGDRLTGRILALDAERLQFRPDVARDADLAIRLPRLARIERTRPELPVEPRGDRVYPLAGGVIHGTLAGVTARSLKLDTHLVGPVQLPLDSLAAFVKNGQEIPFRTAAPELHQVTARSGAPRIGTATFSSGGLTITHGTDTTTVPLHDMETILFPLPEPEPEPAFAAPEPERPPTCVIKLLNGGEIVGSQPQWERDLISVAMAGVGRVAVPTAHVERLNFAPPEIAFGGPRRVIFWSAAADEDEEASHMAQALVEGLPKGWKLDAEAAHPQVADLEADLLEAGVLVVPEMEEFNHGEKLPEPQQIGKVLRAFLERGGTLVLAGVGDAPAAYWKAAGLVSLTACPRANKATFRFAKDTPLAAGVGESFAAVNATHEYQTDDAHLEPVAVRDGGGAAVLVKRVGRGSLVVLGMDYYATSPAVNRLLVNAVTLHRGGQ